MRRYRLISAPAGWPDSVEYRLHFPDGDVGVGDEFDADLSVEDERANVDSGLLEIVPSLYRVVGETEVAGAKQGEEVELALLQEQEAALLGSHLERVEPPKQKKKGARK